MATSAIDLASIEEIESLYEQRQANISGLVDLREQRTMSGSPVPPHVVKQIANKETSVKQLEDRLQRMGMPIDPNDLVDSYSSVSEALQVLRDAREIVKWIKDNFPQQYRKDLLNNSEQSLNPRFTGKWNGAWRSKSDSTESGQVIMATCQVGDELIGSGAFTNSVFSKAYLHGRVIENGIDIKLFADNDPLQCDAITAITNEGKVTVARGTYTVQDMDWGVFEAKLERPNIFAPTKHTRSIEVFLSYSHEDSQLLKGLLTHLVGFQQQGMISTWYDGEIEPGEEWRPEIEQHLNTADIILLLISANFLASDFCNKEMTEALKRHNAGEARVIPVILRQVYWKDTPFASLQVLPARAKPVKECKSRDEAWTDVAMGVRAVVRNLAP